MESPKRIVRNTFTLYIQMLVATLIGLYTSRVLLNVLGVEDFGMYNVIGGVVAMFGVLNSAMSSSTSRFITFELGGGNFSRLKAVFSNSLLIHIGIAILVSVIATPLGLWFMHTHMQIPSSRIEVAEWLLYCTVISTFISILNVPFNAVIIAHERMGRFAALSILDILFKLGIVLVLQVLPFDKLKAYGIMLTIAQVCMQVIYWGYCYRNFEEVRGRLQWNKEQFKEMTSFAGWSLFGEGSYLMFTEGLNILLNIFFGISINAARGIAVQVQGVIARFIVSFQTALNPQITKSYASGDLSYMHRLIYTSSKFSFFLLVLLSLPVFLETENLLRWWLKTVPDHTVNFVRIMLLISLIDCLANPLVLAAKATGNIKIYQLLTGGILLLIVPVSYLGLRLGFSSEYVFIVHLLISIIAQGIRVLLVRKLVGIRLREYFRMVVLRVLVVVVVSSLFPLWVHLALAEGVLRFLLVGGFSAISVLLAVFFLGITKYEKELLMVQVRNGIIKLKYSYK